MHEAQLPRFFIVRAQAAQLRWTAPKEDDETIEIPEALDWELEYILLHERNHATRHEIEMEWNLEDWAKARLALDIADELAIRRQRKAEQEAQAREAVRELNRRPRGR